MKLSGGIHGTDAVNLDQLHEVRDEARRGIAMANAMEVTMPDPGKKFRMNVGLGNYLGETAVGITGAYRLQNTHNDAVVYFGVGTAGNSSFSAKAGVNWQW